MTKPLYFWNGTTFELVGPTTPQSPFAYQTSAPTAPATGDIWIDSDGDVDTYNRQLTRYYFVASAGQTSVSGTDANGLTLAYVAGSEAVYVNGALQVRGVDYTATNGTSITNLSALAVNDVIEVFAYTAFTVANAYTKSETDGLIQAPYRNLIINGAMQVAQRGTSVAGITSGGYNTADRFGLDVSALGTWTQSVENDAPTGSGFRKSLKMLCTTADASPSASDIISITQPIEGQNLQQIAKGTSSAKQLTLSFWVKANVTGTYTILIYDNDNNRATSFAYTISASATWEKKTITIPADTTGTFDNDNAASLTLFWCLGAGSNFTSGSLQSSWATYVATGRAVGQTNLASATNNYWQITGVQLETGSVATPYEFKPIDVELAQCQRYYEKSYGHSVVPGTNSTDGYVSGVNTSDNNQITGWRFAVTKRATPTTRIWNIAGTLGSLSDTGENSTNINNGSWNCYNPNVNGFRAVVGTGGLTSNRTYIYQWEAASEL